MSVTAKKWVRKHSPARGSRRTVLLELAWASDEEGRGANLSSAQLADATGLSARTVKRALADLESGQLIERHHGTRAHCSACACARRGAHVFDVLIGDTETAADPNQMSLSDLASMAQVVTQGQKLTQCQPDTASCVSVTPQEEVEEVSLSLDQVGAEQEFEEHRSFSEAVPQPVARARTREAPPRKPVSYRGRTVPRQTVQDAERLLDIFNEATRGQLAARGRQGQATAALKQIVGALLEHEETVEVWELGVRAMVADPPSWIEDRFTVGHLFGPKASGHTLARGRGDRTLGSPQRPRWGAIADALEAREGVAA